MSAISKSYKVQESEKSYYHVLLTRKTIDIENKKVDIDEQVQIFDKKGFEQFKKFKPADIDEVEILHTPTRVTKTTAKGKS